MLSNNFPKFHKIIKRLPAPLHETACSAYPPDKKRAMARARCFVKMAGDLAELPFAVHRARANE